MLMHFFDLVLPAGPGVSPVVRSKGSTDFIHKSFVTAFAWDLTYVITNLKCFTLVLGVNEDALKRIVRPHGCRDIKIFCFVLSCLYFVLARFASSRRRLRCTGRPFVCCK